MDYKEMLENESQKFEKRTTPLITELELLLGNTSLTIDKVIIDKLKEAKDNLKVFNGDLIDLHNQLENLITFVENNKFKDNKMVVVETNKRIITVLNKILIELTTSIDYVAHKLQNLEKEVFSEEHGDSCSCGNCG